MASITELWKKAKEYLNTSVNDNQGWFRGGQFTPGKQVNDFKTDLPANAAYLKNSAEKAIMPKFELPSSEDWHRDSPEEIKQSRLVSGLFGPVKSMSAQMAEYPVTPNTPTSNLREQQKQKVIANSGFRPAMQRFLSTVPIYTSPINQEFAGQYYENNSTSPPNTPWEFSHGPSVPVINSPTSKNGESKSIEENSDFSDPIIKHELTHATMPIRNKEFNNKFEDFFKLVTPESNPMLYQTGLKYYRDGRTPPNEEEFYATIAQNIGPDVLNVPEIRKYYENLFDEPKTNNVPDYNSNQGYSKLSAPLNFNPNINDRVKK